MDMLVAARRARAHVGDLALIEFASNALVRDATILQLLVIGEAGNTVSEECRHGLATIPWHRIVGMRNRLVHGYGSIDIAEVWSTVTYDLPELIEQLEEALPP